MELALLKFKELKKTYIKYRYLLFIYYLCYWILYVSFCWGVTNVFLTSVKWSLSTKINPVLTGRTPGFILSRRHCSGLFCKPKGIHVSVLFCTTKGHSCICTISHNERTFLYLYYFVQLKGILVSTLLCTTKGHSRIYYFVQLKGILVSTMFRTTKVRSCICTISHNERAFLYLHYFAHGKGILVSTLFRTTKGRSCICTISYN